MEPQCYLVDTNILVHAIRQKKGRWQLLRELVASGGSLACSVITTAGLGAGIRVYERVRTLELLEGLEELEVGSEIARYDGHLKNEWALKGFTLDLPDGIIAATTSAHRLTLVTENPKDFPMPQLMCSPLSEPA